MRRFLRSSAPVFALLCLASAGLLVGAEGEKAAAASKSVISLILEAGPVEYLLIG
ncbi:MAG: hypothetical protein H0X38_06800, partial [Planctomycetes bacterium]|nr:hypothetical protein [Planctomycetota bacterium]